MRHLPLFFDLAGRTVVVVGRAPAAQRRADLARSAGAIVRQLDAASADGLTDAAVAFVATGEAERDAVEAAAIRRAGIPVNVADRPGLCDFILPAIIDRDEVVVAVSTGGASPTLATVVRGRIEALLPERIGRLAALARTFRHQARALIAGPERRRAFWRRLVEGPAGQAALAGDEAGARRLALGELDTARHIREAGMAYIVGAGPGDPDLLTLRAAQLLQDADVILHDDLVPAAILGRARRDAERIAVGKRKGFARWAQRDIEAEMIRRVRAGQTVVRLKAGDPFVFGRGGEEVEALQAAGLPVSVVPGITAVLGVAASAGIPLTHRRIASAVTLVTGHPAEGAQEPAWPALAARGHTIAIYMGAAEAVSVRDRLLDAGACPDLPVAIVENGTRPDERVSAGRLVDLPRLAASHTSRGDAGPSLIIVGEVAALAHVEQPSLAQVS